MKAVAVPVDLPGDIAATDHPAPAPLDRPPRRHDPLRFTGMQARFSAPVFPGETIRTEIWRDGGDG